MRRLSGALGLGREQWGRGIGPDVQHIDRTRQAGAHNVGIEGPHARQAHRADPLSLGPQPRDGEGALRGDQGCLQHLQPAVRHPHPSSKGPLCPLPPPRGSQRGKLLASLPLHPPSRRRPPPRMAAGPDVEALGRRSRVASEAEPRPVSHKTVHARGLGVGLEHGADEDMGGQPAGVAAQPGLGRGEGTVRGWARARASE
mmetsp:Transcript_41600/g.97095  ORF Transcript_41600/g.97095 Transcript_41600/m.97095 type:complete len:200 (+) Transcript_41600:452-1051(+)